MCTFVSDYMHITIEAESAAEEQSTKCKIKMESKNTALKKQLKNPTP